MKVLEFAVLFYFCYYMLTFHINFKKVSHNQTTKEKDDLRTGT